MTKYKGIIILLIIFLLAVGGLYFLAKNNSSKVNQELSPATGYEYYWGNGCPHCARVAEFVESWEGKDKINLQKKEVWNDQTNYLMMQKRAASCNIPQSKLGVPLLYTPDGKCLVGDQPIIDLFKSLTF